MGFFNKIFGKERTMLDKLNEATVGIFRASAPTLLKSLSDKEILEISKEVMDSFKVVSERKNEHIPGGYLLTIAAFFLILYEKSGKEFYVEHLKYELSRYIEYGLREDYKRNLY